jgi:hypothetical protein
MPDKSRFAVEESEFEEIATGEIECRAEEER